MNRQLLQKIEAIRYRAMTLVWIRAVCFSLALVIVSLLLIGTLDWWLKLEFAWLRFTWSVACLSLFLAVWFRWIIPAANYRPDDAYVAQQVGRATGGWQDQLAASVQVARESQRSGRTEREIESRLINDALRRLASIPDSAMMNRKFALFPFLLLCSATLIGGLCYATQSSIVRTSLTRISQPWLDSRWPRQNRLVVDPLPARVARGESVFFVVRDENRNLTEGVFAEVRDSGNRHRRMLELSASSERRSTFEGQLQNVRNDLQVRFVGGDDKSGWMTIDVVDAPVIETLTMLVHPPPSTGLNEQEVSEIVRGPVGSFVSLAGQASLPVKAATLRVQLGNRMESLPLTIASDTFRFQSADEYLLSEPGECWIELKSVEGVESIQPRRYEIEIVKNTPPEIELTLSSNVTGRNSRAGLQIELIDEHPLKSVRVSVYRDSVGPPARLANPEFIPGETPDSDREFRRRFLIDGDIDFSTIDDLATGDQLFLQASAVDSFGNRSESDPVAVEVVSDAVLIEAVVERSRRLSQLLRELILQQSAMASTTRGLSQSIDRQGDRQKLRQQIVLHLDSQRRGLGLFEGGEFATLQLNRDIIQFVEANRLNWPGQSRMKAALSIQESLFAHDVPEILMAMSQISSNLRHSPILDENGLAELEQLALMQSGLENEFSKAESQIRLTVDIGDVIELATALLTAQQLLADDSVTAIQQKLVDPRFNVDERFSSLLTRQRRVRSETEWLDRQMQRAVDDAVTSDIYVERLTESLRYARSAALVAKLLEVESAISEKRPGRAREVQSDIVTILQQLVSLLSAKSSDSSHTLETSGIVDQISQIIEQLNQFNSQLREYTESKTDLNSSQRMQLDNQKQALLRQMTALRDVIDASLFSDSVEQVEQAIGSLSRSPESNRRQDLESESDHVRSAINQLQQLAMAIATHARQDQQTTSDLNQLLEFVKLLMQVQASINQWTIEQSGSALAMDDPMLRQTVNMQQTVTNSLLQGAHESLAQSPTAAILIDRIAQQQQLSRERLAGALLDAPTMNVQSRIINGMQQLVETIEIQLEANRNTNEISSDSSSDQLNRNKPGISSFELTMLYVMQKNIHRETQLLMEAVESNGEETTELRQWRQELSETQHQIAAVLGKLLEDHERPVPKLPDF